MKFTIHDHLLRSSDSLHLLEQIQASPYIGSWTQKDLDFHIKAQTIRFFYSDTTLAGMSAWVVFDHGNWSELGPFFTLEEWRGKGLGSLLIETSMKENKKYGRNIYAVTKNTIVKHKLSTLGFKKLSLFHLPKEVLYYIVRTYSILRVLQHLKSFHIHEMPAYYVLDKGKNL